jgi:transcriptional regulator with XRE-family HTH domain
VSATVWSVQDEWDRNADKLEAGQPRLGRFPIPGLIRAVRRTADLSQHELAKRAGLAQSTVARIESGSLVPSVTALQRLLACAGFELVVVDQTGHVVQPMREAEWTRDGADRRYPSHLDTILNPKPGQWWGDQYGLVCPPETFVRDRARRDEQRRRSQWEVRVKQFRFAPMPSLQQEREEAERIRQERLREWASKPEPPADWYDDLD